ncbi:FBD domain, Leucine-rich repeat domain, L domain-like protein [Artemisia annua]|uniref:FBD domain, Leucine-rich repeat domain, L domain-like protein n=1 Tax=Artemisia annua TaxID=35608 RepID=A0A2U1QGE7_ARTAN|nr:FBD domain, Leucine-rich repeat domain, L domain-like protein [Artemisia annua]
MNVQHMGSQLYTEFTFVELLQCVPLIRTLDIQGSWMEVFEQIDAPPISIKFLDLHDYGGFNLDHLEYFEMESFGNSPFEMELVRLIMANSPVLKKVRLELSCRVSIDEELEILRLPRASSSTMLTIER